VLEYNNTNKIITNYLNRGKGKDPITNFNYKPAIFSQTIDFTLLDLKVFYKNRKFEDQFIVKIIPIAPIAIGTGREYSG
jgi:hypothetical protein